MRIVATDVWGCVMSIGSSSYVYLITFTSHGVSGNFISWRFLLPVASVYIFLEIRRKKSNNKKYNSIDTVIS